MENKVFGRTWIGWNEVTARLRREDKIAAAVELSVRSQAAIATSILLIVGLIPSDTLFA